ncbi:MAG: hypothetical protein Tsb002_29450 [Wenzhouxiangellaceae bacterium]
MRHETQVETLKTLLKQREIDRDQATIEQPVEVPVKVYMDEDILQRERDLLFRRYPLVAGHASKVAEPGSFFVSEWDQFPYVVVRGQDGQLRAFLNICRHRGTRLVSEEQQDQSLKAFICPYHGWVYELDGSLRTVTKEYNFPGLDCSKKGLIELPVLEHKGLIWIHPTPGAEIDLKDYLGEQINDDLAHFGLDQLVLHRRKVSTLEANWKLLIKTYLDRYHVPILHRNTIAEYFRKGVIAHYEHGPHIRIAAGLTGLPEAAKVEPEQWRILNYASVLYTLFPNTYLIIHTNLVSINRFYPIAPGKTIWVHEMLYRQGDYEGEQAQQELAVRFGNIDAVFHHEDFGIAENCQKGLGYGDQTHLLGLEEGLLAIFQDNIDRLLAE